MEQLKGIGGEYAELLEAAGTFDKLCKKGCESEDELAEFDHGKRQVCSVAFRLAQVLKTAETKTKRPTHRGKIPIKDCPKTPDCYITFAEAATMLGVTKGTVSRWTGQDKLRDNGKTGQNRKVSKTSVLMLKEQRQQQELAEDAADIRRDSALISSKH